MAIYYPAIEYGKTADTRIGLCLDGNEITMFKHDVSDSESDLREQIEAEFPTKKVLTTHLPANRSMVAIWAERYAKEYGATT